MHNAKKRFKIILLLPLIFLIISLFFTLYYSYSNKRKNTISTKAKETISLTVTKKSSFDSTLLAKYITTEAVLLGSIDHMSYYFQDLNSNSTLKMDPEHSWIPASTIKAFVVLEAFRQRDLGLIDFSKTITVNGKNVVPTALESDEFPRLREGTPVTIKQLIEAMIIQSDNTAFNVLLDVLDRRNINITLKNYGLTETVVGEKLSLDDNQLAIDLTVQGRQANTTTAKDLASFYNFLFTHKIPESEEIIAIFKRQKFKDMIPAHIPPKVEVAHKTGEWDPYYHDGGIIYKPEQPFIFTAFSNSGNPESVAKIARVAYYQSADVVGKPVAVVSPINKLSQNHPIYYLSQIPSTTDVLGVSTVVNSKFPSITAQDLGITSSDFGINPAFSQIISKAFILPGSPLFPLKRLVEEMTVVTAKNPDEKAHAYLEMAHSRISEAKTFFAQKKFTEGYQLLNQSEIDLTMAVTEKGKHKDFISIEIKQLSDLRFSLLSETADKIDASQKMQLIDSTYNLYKRYETEVAPRVMSSAVTNPTQQKPIVGIITTVNGDTATLKLNDSTTKKILITDTTPLRDFQNNSIQSASHLTAGTQISVIGTVSTGSVIVPQFILNNVPRELPKAHEGTVIEVDPNKNTLTIINAQGKQDIVSVDQRTLLKSRDTNVSLEGIKTGSFVTVFGVTTPNPSPTLTITSFILTPTQTISVMPISGIITPPQVGKGHDSSFETITNSPISITTQMKITMIPTTTQQKSTTPNGNKPSSPEIKAVSLTVVSNASGKKELTKPSKLFPPVKPTKTPKK